MITTKSADQSIHITRVTNGYKMLVWLINVVLVLMLVCIFSILFMYKIAVYNQTM